MDRRNFTRTTLGLAGAASLGTFATVNTVGAQTPDASPSASPAANVWESAEDPITIEWDTDVFGEASTSGITGEWCVLRIEDIEHFLSFIIMLEDKYPTDLAALKDYVETDDELGYVGQDPEIERISVVEENDAVGVFYQPNLEHAMDTWSYSEFIPSEDGSHRTIHLWINSRVSKLDREMMESAVSSVTINGEPAVRAIDVADLFDQVEAIEVEDAE